MQKKWLFCQKLKIAAATLTVGLAIAGCGRWQQPVETPKNDKSFALSEEDNLVIITISDFASGRECVIATRASVFHKFSAVWINNDEILFKSSDIGDSVYRVAFPSP